MEEVSPAFAAGGILLTGLAGHCDLVTERVVQQPVLNAVRIRREVNAVRRGPGGGLTIDRHLPEEIDVFKPTWGGDLILDDGVHLLDRFHRSLYA